MSKRIGFLLILLFAVVIYWASIQDGHNGGPSMVGKLAPEFNLKDEQGKPVKLSDYRGKVVLVHFWATWCAPCVEEFPSFDKLVRKFNGTEFVFLPLSVDEEGGDAIRQFRKKVSFSFPVVLDSRGDTADEYGTYRLPESYLIDKEGKTVRKIVGPQNWEDPKWEKMIRKIL